MLLLGMVSPRKHHLKDHFLRSWCERKFEGIEEENILLPCVQHQADKKALCSMSVLKSGYDGQHPAISMSSQL